MIMKVTIMILMMMMIMMMKIIIAVRGHVKKSGGFMKETCSFGG